MSKLELEYIKETDEYNISGLKYSVEEAETIARFIESNEFDKYVQKKAPVGASLKNSFKFVVFRLERELCNRNFLTTINVLNSLQKYNSFFKRSLESFTTTNKSHTPSALINNSGGNSFW